MAPLASIARIAVARWSPVTAHTSSEAYLVTGTVTSSPTDPQDSPSLSPDHDSPRLELWRPFDATPLEPCASLPSPARFHSIAWNRLGTDDAATRPLGTIAAGLENGAVCLWDPHRILNEPHLDPLVNRFDLHSGPVRALAFSAAQPNLLASGSANGEVSIYDLSQPHVKPFSPGPRSRSIETVTCLDWNPSVVHILATGSNSGYTVVWDLKSKREITALLYHPAGTQTGLGQAGFGTSSNAGGAGGIFGGGGPGVGSNARGGAAVGGLGGISSVKWHPENPTKLITASDDDHNPVILVWDLRNWKEPERVLRGHEKGILSISWCQQDPDLILSSGKDGRTITWSCTTGEIVAEVKPSSDWVFDVGFCPHNPSIISAASLDGTITLHSLQSTGTPESQPEPSSTQTNNSSTTTNGLGSEDPFNLFEQAISANVSNHPTKSLQVVPRWLQRPSSVSFGFGGKLVKIRHERFATTTTTPGGPVQKIPKLEIVHVVTSNEIVERAEALERAATGQLEGGFAAFCDHKTQEPSNEEPSSSSSSRLESWKLLQTLLRAAVGGQSHRNREQLVELLGFDQDRIESKIQTALDKFRTLGKTLPLSTSSQQQPEDPEQTQDESRTPLDNRDDVFNERHGGGGGSSSLFDEPTPSQPLQDSFSTGIGGGDDFFANLGNQDHTRLSALPERLRRQESMTTTEGFNSTAATNGSNSSVASFNLKPTTLFKLYEPEQDQDFENDEVNVDRLITQALVIGDFTSAVSLALAVDRYADAILFALRGGPELLTAAQTAYFQRSQPANETTKSYLRVFESITNDDLEDLVQHVDLKDWIEVFVLVCTYSTGVERSEPSRQQVEFGTLIELLGQRLEHRFQLARSNGELDADQWRKHAVVCYLAAGKLEQVVHVWIAQMQEEESRTLDHAIQTKSISAISAYETRAQTLQEFVEKVQVFQHAVGYVDVDLTANPGSSKDHDKTFKLASLYERYVEYAELLADQGLSTLAIKYINLIPRDFVGTNSERGGAAALARARLLTVPGTSAATRGANPYGRTSQQPQPTSRYGVPAYGQVQPGSALSSSTRSAYNPYSTAAPASAVQPSPSSYSPYATNPAVAAPPALGQTAQQNSPYAAASNPYAPAPVAADNPYAPAPVLAAPPSAAANPYAAAPAPSSASTATSSFVPAFPSAIQSGPVHDPYAPVPGNPGAGLPAPPAIREASPNFANRQPVPAAAPPPPRAKPEQGWNDAPILSRKSTPAATAAAVGGTAGGGLGTSAPRVQAITSPFPNMPATGAPAAFGTYATPGQPVPPPPPSRGSNRTPAPPPPPPASGSRFIPPPPQQQQQQQQPQAQAAQVPPPPSAYAAPPPQRVTSNYAPPPPLASSAATPSQFATAPPPPPASTNQYAPPPPASTNQYAPAPPQSNNQYAPPPQATNQFAAAAPPPPRSGTPGTGISTSFNRPPPPRSTTATPPPNAPNFPPRPPSAGANRSGFQPLTAAAPGPPPPPASSSAQARPPPPPSAQANINSSRPPPPPSAQGQGPANGTMPPPPLARPGSATPSSTNSNNGMAPPPPSQPPAAPPVQTRPEPPKLKYPPGDRTHIPVANRPIFDILSVELRRLRQTTPPQQAKMINETEKRLNMLFDLINSEILSPSSTEQVLEICKAIESRNQPLALELHLGLLTTSNDVAPFQAALKLVIQRMS
ncbi:uncharacterized protein JCM15063_003772 [Sporobolomyces koalae]|uniref:uncharacterized protein n=1 Tax=Sporobolomyces koalae TaxID=500713 RepID=UPI00317A20C2